MKAIGNKLYFYMIKQRAVKFGLLPRVAVAILAGSLLGMVAPVWLARFAVTFTGLFGSFLDFAIPLVILGLVAPGIAEIGNGAGRLLALTVGIAYGATVFSGFFTYGVTGAFFPSMLKGVDISGALEGSAGTEPFFTLAIPPVMSVMTALVLAFVLGLALASMKSRALRDVLSDFREVVNKLITNAIIPVLPFYILFIFLDISASGQVGAVMSVFILIIAVIFALHVILILLYFTAAGAVAGGNPLKYLDRMLPAYFTALGTQSSAATIPVTLEQTLSNGVDKDIAGFVIPLCATVHLSGSMMKITACAVAIMVLSGIPFGFGLMTGFILLLGITMIAAPGVPGGAIMAALGVLSAVLGFEESMLGLMIALYIAMDSFGTACNVTCDGAIAIVIDKIYKNHKKKGLQV